MVVGEFTTDVDVLVIGSGPGGYVAAIRAAQLGKQVTIIERAELGGVCLNRGCIPSKALISAAKRYEEMKQSKEAGFGIIAEQVHIDFSKVQTWKEKVVRKLTGGVESLLKGNKVDIVKGEALFMNQNEVRVVDGYDVHRFRFNHCILATGSQPIELKAFPYGKRVLSSTEALQLEEIPNSMVIIGGGYIGVELGQTFAKLGTKITILEGEESILSAFEPELIKPVIKNLQKSGVEIITKAIATGLEDEEEQVIVKYAIAQGKEQQVVADYVLVTVGRRPNLSDIGLDAAGVKTDERGYVQINDRCQTTNPMIYAIGDLVPGPALAHKASYEGKVAAEVIAGQKSGLDYKVIPAVVFSDPEIATVGLTEQEAKDEGYQVKVGKFPFAANGRALSLNASEGFVKLVAEKESGIILGAQVVGIEASNLIAELTLAIELGATLEDIALTIHAHPTLGELTMEAAEVALGQAIHTMAK